MSRPFLLSLLCVLIVGAAATAYGQEKAHKTEMLPARLDDAISFALANRVELALAAKEREAASLRVKVAAGKFLPRLLLSGSSKYLKVVDRFTGSEINGSVGGEEVHVKAENFQPRYEWRAGADFIYNLYSGGQDSASVVESQAEQKAQRYEESSIKSKVSLEVTKTYWTLRKAQVETGMAQRSYQLAQKHLLVAETKISSGLNPGSDSESERLVMQEAELAVAEAKSNEEVALTKYCQSLGLYALDYTVYLSGFLLLDAPEDVREPVLLAASLQPEARRLQAELKAAEARVKFAEGSYLPKVDFTSSYNFVGRDDANYFRGISRMRSDYYTIGINVSFTVFDGFWDRVALAKRQEEMGHLRLRQALEQLESQNQEKLNGKQKLQREAYLAQQRLKLYEGRRNMVAVRYRNGKLSELEYLEAEKTYKDFADKLLLSQIDLALSKLLLAISNRQ